LLTNTCPLTSAEHGMGAERVPGHRDRNQKPSEHEHGLDQPIRQLRDERGRHQRYRDSESRAPENSTAHDTEPCDRDREQPASEHDQPARELDDDYDRREDQRRDANHERSGRGKPAVPRRRTRL
jgi:hypothetical protein